MIGPRATPSRQDRYMGLAFFHASFSKDPNTQVGAIIVNKNNEIVGTGYNGPPASINDNEIDWSRPNKYKYIKHAESNAIKHASSTENTTLYVTGMPCDKCMIEVADAKISNIIYFDMNKIVEDNSSMLADVGKIETALEIARLSKITITKYKGDLNWMKNRIDYLSSLGIFSID